MSRIILIFLVFLVGCDVQAEGQITNKADSPLRYMDRQQISFEFYEMQLDDGTRCIVFDYADRGGISCDWAIHSRYSTRD